MAEMTLPRMDVRIPGGPIGRYGEERWAPDALDGLIGRRFTMDIDLTSRGVSVRTTPAQVEVVAVEVDADGRGAMMTIQGVR